MSFINKIFIKGRRITMAIDRRIRKTKALLRSGLTDLMKQKPVNKITVKELADYVDINRGTFYLHHKDIFDLLSSIESELMQELKDVFDKYNFEKQQIEPLLFLTDIFHFLDHNAEIVTVLLSSNGDILFIDQMKEFVKENFYNNRIKEFLDSSSGADLCDLLDGIMDMRSVLSYIEGDSAQSQGVLAEMYSVVRDIFIGVFAEKGGFSIRNFVRRKGGRTLFIEYDLSIGSVLTPVYKIMFDLALKEALGQTNSKGNVYLICDEFKLLPNLQHIDDGVNFGRSLGVKVFAGLQSIEQLYEIYGQSRGKNLAAWNNIG